MTLEGSAVEVRGQGVGDSPAATAFHPAVDHPAVGSFALTNRPHRASSPSGHAILLCHLLAWLERVVCGAVYAQRRRVPRWPVARRGHVFEDFLYGGLDPDRLTYSGHGLPPTEPEMPVTRRSDLLTGPGDMPEMATPKSSTSCTKPRPRRPTNSSCG